MKELTVGELEVLNDMLQEFSDKLSHFPDAELGWEEGEVQSFNNLYDKVIEEGQLRKFWWAR